ncbi:glutathione S-transferase family protein [Sphingomicrobium sp. XHP0235]|uniref:glutathione S-transferase family protein n=1 Tax=Sphingomicrobium aquimarinum TaxID=3133971 RepID=UPI0031FE58EB
MSQITIFGASMSPFVRKVIAGAIEKGVDFKLKTVGFQDPDPDFRRASPLGKMPAILDGDYGLADSSAILHYLDARYDGPALLPADPQARGRAVWWDEYGDTELFAVGRKLFFNRIVAPLFLKREGDAAMADRAEAEDLPRVLDFLEERVPDVDGFLIGNTLTIADLAVASPFVNLDHANAAIDWTAYPRLDAWTKAMASRPSFANSIAHEQGFFAKIGHKVAGRLGAA